MHQQEPGGIIEFTYIIPLTYSSTRNLRVSFCCFNTQVSVVDELGIPVKFVGVGEGVDDLQPFDAEAFVNAIFS